MPGPLQTLRIDQVSRTLLWEGHRLRLLIQTHLEGLLPRTGSHLAGQLDQRPQMQITGDQQRLHFPSVKLQRKGQRGGQAEGERADV